MDILNQHMEMFKSGLDDANTDEKETDLIHGFFSQKIPIRVLLRYQSRFYQRKLLRVFYLAGFDALQPIQSE